MYGEAQNGVTVILTDDWDNESSYRGCEFMACSQDDFLLRRILFWVKLALIKVAQSYYAFPFVLFMLPLIIGLLLGYFLGRRPQRRSKQQPSGGVTLTLRLFVESILFCAFKLLPGHKQEGSIEASENEAMAKMKAISLVNNQKVIVNSECRETIAEIPSLVHCENEARKILLENEGAIHVQFPTDLLPRHVAVVMDGNRRYGREKYGNTTAGHWDGCRKLLDMATWCQGLGISILTVYAFSTENWNRTEAEVSALFAIFCRYADELREESIKRKFAVKVLTTDYRHRIPHEAERALKRLEEETARFKKDGCLQINVCLSYGSRGEIVNACRSLTQKCIEKSCDPKQYITEASISKEMLTPSDPDILIRTSGEIRLSNFLLWQLAYTELFFVNKMWPDFEKEDFVGILQDYAKGRQRRYGK